MGNLALRATLEARPGKEEEVARFLRDGLAVAEAEPGTLTWFAVRQGPSTFGIFDTFADEDGRQAHLNGPLAAALMERADELFTHPPQIDQLDVLAHKLP